MNERSRVWRRVSIGLVASALAACSGDGVGGPGAPLLPLGPAEPRLPLVTAGARLPRIDSEGCRFAPRIVLGEADLARSVPEELACTTEHLDADGCVAGRTTVELHGRDRPSPAAFQALGGPRHLPQP